MWSVYVGLWALDCVGVKKGSADRSVTKAKTCIEGTYGQKCYSHTKVLADHGSQR